MEVPEQVQVTDGGALVLTWPGGIVTRVAAPTLRAACQCAICLDPGGKGTWSGDPATVRILDATLVGAYALSFTFAPDQHHTGIYPFDRLRKLDGIG